MQTRWTAWPPRPIAPKRSGFSEACLLENEIDPADRTVVHWLTLADTIRGFPRHLSQHPGGFVIGRDKSSRLVPVENAVMDNRSSIQWDKDDLDSTRLIKVDIFALGMLDGPNVTKGTASEAHRERPEHRASPRNPDKETPHAGRQDEPRRTRSPQAT